MYLKTDYEEAELFIRLEDINVLHLFIKSKITISEETETARENFEDDKRSELFRFIDDAA